MSEDLVKNAADRIIARQLRRISKKKHASSMHKKADIRDTATGWFNSAQEGLANWKDRQFADGISSGLKQMGSDLWSAKEPWQQYVRNAGIGALGGGALGALGSIGDKDRSLFYDGLRGATAGGLLGLGGTAAYRNLPWSKRPGDELNREIQSAIEERDGISPEARSMAAVVADDDVRDALPLNRYSSIPIGVGALGEAKQLVNDRRLGRLAAANPSEAGDIVEEYLRGQGISSAEAARMSNRIRNMGPQEFTQFAANNKMLDKAYAGNVRIPKPSASTHPNVGRGSSIDEYLGKRNPLTEPRPGASMGTGIGGVERVSPGGGVASTADDPLAGLSRRQRQVIQAKQEIFDALGVDPKKFVHSPGRLEGAARKAISGPNYRFFRGSNPRNSILNLSGVGAPNRGFLRRMARRPHVWGIPMAIAEPYVLDSLKEVANRNPITNDVIVQQYRDYIANGGDPADVPKAVLDILRKERS